MEVSAAVFFTLLFVISFCRMNVDRESRPRDSASREAARQAVWDSSELDAGGKLNTVTRGELRWALHRMGQDGRDRVIARIPDNPKLGDRDRRLARDLFDEDMDVADIQAKHGINTIHGAKTAIGLILDNLVKDPVAQEEGNRFLKWSQGVPDMSVPEVRDSLRSLSPEEVGEIIKAVPEHTWKERSVIPEHRRIALTYFERDDWSVREFVNEYNARHPEAGLKDRKADQTIKHMLERISREPALRERLQGAAPSAQEGGENAINPGGEDNPSSGQASTPPGRDRQGETAKQPTEPARAAGKVVPESKDSKDALAEQVDTPSGGKPQEPGGVKKEGAVDSGPAPTRPKAKAAGKKKGQDLAVQVGDISSFDDLMDVLNEYGKKFSHNMKNTLKAAGLRESRELKKALRDLPSARATGSFMDEVNRDIHNIGKAIPVALSFIRTQPAETVEKIAGHIEESPLQFMDKTLSFNDAPRICFYRMLARQAASGAVITSYEGLAKRAGQAEKQWDEAFSELTMSGTVEASFRPIMEKYGKIAESAVDTIG